MHESMEHRPFSEMVSMERNRDSRDYALINGFSHAKDFLDSLEKQLIRGDRILDMGCGKGKAISQIGRELSLQGINCLALDRELPERQYKFLEYIDGTFSETGLEDNSVDLIVSVCGLLYYAEDEQDLHEHVKETERILASNGELSAVVDPVIYEHDRMKISLAQLATQEIRLQSPTINNKSFKINVCNLLKDEGLRIDRRILPKGGMMIDDEITLIIKKGK